MPKVEWELKPELGKTRIAKRLAKPEGESARSAGLVCRWLRFLAFQDPPGAKPRVAPALLDFPADVLEKSKASKRLIKDLKGPGTKPDDFMKRLSPIVRLEFTPAKKSSFSGNTDNNNPTIPLEDAIKSLGEDKLAFVLVTTSDGSEWDAFGLQCDKRGRRLFHPYKGQIQWTAVDEAAEEIETHCKEFDAYALYLVDALEAAKKGAVWEWDFFQSKMITALMEGEHAGTDVGIIFPLIKDQLGCDGVCLEMTYDWLKCCINAKPVSSGSYFDPGKFGRLASKQVRLHDQFVKLAERALEKKWEFTVVPEPHEQNAPPELTGYFGGKVDQFIAKLDKLKDGFYLIGFYGADDGHCVGLHKNGKTGKFFDANLGYCAIYPGGHTLAEVVKSVFLLPAHEKMVKAAPSSKNPVAGSYFFSRLEKK